MPNGFRSFLRRHTWRALVSVGALGLVSLIGGRAWLVDAWAGYAFTCYGCLYRPTLASDALIAAIILALFAVNLTSAPLLLRGGANLACAVLILTYLADMILFASFNTRLDLNDTKAFLGDLGATKATVSWLLGQPRRKLFRLVAGGVALLLLACYLVLLSRVSAPRPSRWGVVGLLAAALGLVTAYALSGRVDFAHAWAAANVIDVNRGNGINVEYSSAQAARLLRQGGALSRRDRCFPGRNMQPSIVFVLFESLSNYQSSFFSGLQDLTPNVDRIAGRGTAHRRFYANGWTTDGGLIALFTGRVPIPPVGGFTRGGSFRYEGLFDEPDTLPKLLQRAGYRTAFLGTADLSYGGTAAWLRSIGFDYVEGHDAPAYDGVQRFIFDAAPDEYLYRRAFDFLSTQSNRHPVFLVLETVSSHFPFMNPVSGVGTEAAAFGYADAALGTFINELDARKFLSRNLLIVSGDHRAMTPIRAAETERFGPSSSSLVPMIIVGGDFSNRHTVDIPHQQIDLLPSIEYLVSERYCMSRMQGNLFDASQRPAECILAVGGGRRDVVQAFCGKDYAEIMLRGDATTVISGRLPDPGAYLDAIGYARLRLRSGMAASPSE
jgi:lipoteichoic acid synthase